MDALLQSTEAIDACIAAMRPRVQRRADSAILAELKALHDRYLAHVRSVVAEIADDEVASELNDYANGLADIDHDSLTGGAIGVAERVEAERDQPDWDQIREDRAENRAYWAAKNAEAA